MKIIILKFFLIATFISSCGQDKKQEKDKKQDIIPSDLTLKVTLKGKDDDNPNGDGSGAIKAIASAKNAEKYNFSFGTGEVIENKTGIAEYTFQKEGLKEYTVSVVAYSSTGNNIKESKKITILKKRKLLWADEFDNLGSPDKDKWTYDIGVGNNGWGNQESQYYTDRSDNVIVDKGVLKIIAKKENYKGSNYTSTRLKTQGKFSFTYGKVEVRAKLPKGVGTWPAIWMLGDNIKTVGWPKCGEIDIMEHVGRDMGKVSSALHNLSSHGNTVNTKAKRISNVADKFHIYSMEWNAKKISFAIDGDVYYEYNPSVKDENNWPYDKPFFIILNIAMGGTFGGAISNDFKQAIMEIDYVRVYGD